MECVGLSRVVSRQALVHLLFSPELLQLWLALFAICSHVELCLRKVDGVLVRACMGKGLQRHKSLSIEDKAECNAFLHLLSTAPCPHCEERC